MQINEYQKRTISTAIYPGAGERGINEFSYLALGLSSESGEVAGKIKKLLRDNSLLTEDVVAELGDVFWYVARLCDALGVDCETVLELNYKKLQDRKTRGVLGGNGDTR